jgi:Fe-S-cluster containining protein
MKNPIIDFEIIHNEFDGMMFDLCEECGGQCEKNNLTLFLPGEAEYIAKKLNIEFKKFIKEYCNIVKISETESVYILKAGTCPFLDKNFRCELEKPNCKPVRCMLYPILIGAPENRKNIFIDFEECPMAYKLTKKFIKQATKIYEDIKEKIPAYWLEFVSEYNYYIYDYTKLKKLRNKNIIILEELKKCRIR